MNSNLVFLLASVFLGACGQLLLKLGVNRIGDIDLSWPAVVQTLLSIFTNLWVMTGIVCFVTSMILWIKVLSKMELSKAYPSVSISYIIVFVFSVILFNESVSFAKILGMVLVSIGVYYLQA